MIGKQVKGKVRNMTAYGAFVELEEGIDGMVHVSDLSWTRKINHPSEILKKNDEIDAVVIDIDKANQRIALGVKQLDEDPWKEIDRLYKIGDLVKGKVTKLANFGAFVSLEHDIDGLVHISQLSEGHVAKVKDVIKVGDEVEARVIKVDKVERRIGLSIKAANYSDEALRNESEAMETTMRSGEEMVGLAKAFEAAELDEYRPGEGKRIKAQRTSGVDIQRGPRNFDFHGNHRLPQNQLRLEQRRPRHPGQIRPPLRREGHPEEPRFPGRDGAAERTTTVPLPRGRRSDAPRHQRRRPGKLAGGQRPHPTQRSPGRSPDQLLLPKQSATRRLR